MVIIKEYSILCAEIATLFLVFGILLISPDLGGLVPLVKRWATSIAVHPGLSMAICFGSPLLMRVVLLPWIKVPVPYVHDEASFLFMADTFAHGRLANSPHPLWIHFETFHILQHPTYSSIYPVMQGLFLYFGQMVFHSAWVGVMVSVGLLCAAIYWALWAWVPPFWALTGAMIAVLRLGVLSYWMNSYWGGAAAALGGALVFGATPRIFRKLQISDSLLLALGLVVLANSRPYEGAFYCLPVVLVFLGWVLGKRGLLRWFGLNSLRAEIRFMLRRAIAPAACVLIVAAGIMGYYFWRVTGDPLTMPRTLEARQYSITPLFLWQKLRPAPDYNDDRLRFFYTEWEPNESSEAKRAFAYWTFYLGPALTLPLLFSWIAVRYRKMRFPLILCATCTLALAIEWWDLPHYAAPIVAPLYALFVQVLRYFSARIRRSSKYSRWRGAPAIVPVTVATMIIVALMMRKSSIAWNPSWPPAWAGRIIETTPRAMVEEYLQKQGGRHLVLIRYVNHSRDPAIHSEWVFNSPDIDESQIVWARELDSTHNQILFNYFKDRRIWLCSPDEGSLAPIR